MHLSRDPALALIWPRLPVVPECLNRGSSVFCLRHCNQIKKPKPLGPRLEHSRETIKGQGLMTLRPFDDRLTVIATLSDRSAAFINNLQQLPKHCDKLIFAACYTCLVIILQRLSQADGGIVQRSRSYASCTAFDLVNDLGSI